VPALDQQVGGGHHPAVRCGQHRGVVPDSDDRPVTARKCRRDRLDQAELAEVGDGHENPPWRRVRMSGPLALPAAAFLRPGGKEPGLGNRL
jgi:hypothetical protein